MASDPSRYEIHYHPNANVTQLVAGGMRNVRLIQLSVTDDSGSVASHVSTS